MILYFNAATDQTIQNEYLQSVTLEEAKAAWLAGKVTDCSASFQRLANNDFDIDATMAEYREMDA